MIKRPTVFVLGAGASAPYGFPSGPRLARDVHRALLTGSQDAGLLGALHETHAIDFALVNQFITDWPRAGCETLDEFVQSNGNRRFLPLVKAAIVEQLIAAEREENLLGFEQTPWSDERATSWRDRDWYGYLFHELRGDVDHFGSNKLTIITFNFDRSFERRLFLSIQKSYGIDADAAGRLSGSIRVLHVHGNLGGPAWLGERRQDSREYAPAASAEQRQFLATHAVKLIHDEIDVNVLEEAHRHLQTAEVVCFLGLGYHPTNLDRLRVTDLAQSVRGTALGFTEAELAPVKRAFASTTVELFRDYDCRKFLRETNVLHGDPPPGAPRSVFIGGGRPQ